MTISTIPSLRHYLALVAVLLTQTNTVLAQGPTQIWDKAFGGTEVDVLRSTQQTTDGGYILGGFSTSGVSGNKTQANRGQQDYWVVKVDAAGIKQWDRTYGGNQGDYLRSVRQTTDGGFILGGYSSSGISGDRTAPNPPDANGFVLNDYWLIKLDSQGNKQWDRAYGGTGADLFDSVLQTADGGYILAGKSYSGVSPDKSQPSRGQGDYWIIKTDAQGVRQWDRTLGGIGEDELSSMQITADGGYIVGGWSNSGISGERTQLSRGGNDYWIVKLNSQGNTEWDRAYGGNQNDALWDLRQTPDGGYILGGSSSSGISGEKSEPHYGPISVYPDYWIVKIAGDGTRQWDRTFGGDDYDDLFEICTTADGGYALGGRSRSGISGNKAQPNRSPASNPATDYWLVKVDSNGGKQWEMVLGGTGGDDAYTLMQTPDNGYLMGGVSDSDPSIYKTQPSYGSGDFWIVKLVPPAAPQLRIQGDSVLCPGRQSTLIAQATPVPTSFRWNTGATTASIVVGQPGTYSVVTSFGTQTLTAQRQVSQAAAAPLSQLSLGPDTLLCAGKQLLLQLPGLPPPGLRYRWSDGSTSSSLLVNKSGLYSLTLSSACDARTLNREVTFSPCVIIPNIITPNDDRYNDQFVIQGVGGEIWQLEMYNRWGKQIYQTTHYQNDWGLLAAPGTYFYRLSSTAAKSVYIGWLEVVR